MKIRSSAVVAALALGLVGLSSIVLAQKVDVETAMDKGVTLKGLRTYTWLPPPPAPPPTVAPDLATRARRTIEQINPLVRGAVDRELGAKGYQRIESGDADLLVGYLVNMGADANAFTMADDYAALTGATIYFSFGPPARTSSLSYAELGTLVVGVLSAETKDVMWRGVAKTKITFETPHSQVDRAMDEGIRKMFRKFPKHAK